METEKGIKRGMVQSAVPHDFWSSSLMEAFLIIENCPWLVFGGVKGLGLTGDRHGMR